MELDYDLHLNDLELERRLSEASDLSRPLRAIGEALVHSTKQRFHTSTAPDGTQWEPLSDATIARRLRKGVSGRKPLIGESRRLSEEIHAQVSGNQVSVGSSLIYSATQQFGANKGEFGKDKRGHAIPWGDIPARPFLGLSHDDETEIERILKDHIAASLH